MTLFAKLVKKAQGLSDGALDKRLLEVEDYADDSGDGYGEEYFRGKKYPGPTYLYYLFKNFKEEEDISIEDITSLAMKMLEFQNQASCFSSSKMFGNGEGGAVGLLTRLVYLFTKMQEKGSRPEPEVEELTIVDDVVDDVDDVEYSRRRSIELLRQSMNKLYMMEKLRRPMENNVDGVDDSSEFRNEKRLGFFALSINERELGRYFFLFLE